MHISAEIRWFWRDAAPSGLEEWFRSSTAHPYPAGGGATRVDHYVRDGIQKELGIKRRGSRKGVEVKGLVSVITSPLDAAPFVGPIEIWAKWPSASLDLSACVTVAVEKRRWVRGVDTGLPLLSEIPLGADEAPLMAPRSPGRGSRVEVTSIAMPGGKVWWTLGFEAFGALDQVENDLRAVAAMLAKRNPPPLGGGRMAGYPAWLADEVLSA